MKKTFEFSKVLSSRGDAAWELLSKLGGVDEWFPMVTTCRLDTSGPVARRFCELAGGMAVEESITEVDEAQRTVRYTVDKGLPADRYEGTFMVRSRADGPDEVCWRVDVEGAPEVVAQLEGMLEQAAEGALSGLDEKARSLS